ncbi:aminotransferase class V-fold PLP-dependent enzyme [Flocculibacter collagenilyticus]|uniref:aminotransferase class V-fold PLP-dependent enzyme n=1 Tax=Flocculibacter collagenilyticus TaxID=2744479 RepID=UPI0018F37E7D|nr:aminotransferase class V-fold PLP-dependent enzyme [Flocculibacter collagenilyticus]
MSLENYFAPYRKNIIGIDLTHELNGAIRPIIYADWTASGRLYRPVEEFISYQLGPYVANTHTETNLLGCTMTNTYHQAQQTIKEHVNACENDVLICAGAGMTAVINKFQRILGLRIPERMKDQITFEDNEKPVVFITHMEHHSNQTTWSECDVTLEIVKANDKGLPCLNHLDELLQQYSDRRFKIGSFTACSNVTGIKTPYHQLAEIMHEHGGVCFVDFAASAPYVDINMHPANPKQQLDAIFFSPHKFLGGPASSGVLIFNRALYKNKVPDHPGGGTVSWTNPWGEHKFFDNIQVREDGGTPGFLQCIRTALAIKVKESMGTDKIAAREHELTQYLMGELTKNERVLMLEDKAQERLCIVSFYVLGMHHNLIVKILNDRFGIQTRGGCSCAGTYGHILLQVDPSMSKKITEQIDSGDLTEKPGWVRVSLHPTTSDQEARAIVSAINQTIENADLWAQDYFFNPSSGEFKHRNEQTSYPSLDGFEATTCHKPKPKSSILNKLFKQTS